MEVGLPDIDQEHLSLGPTSLPRDHMAQPQPQRLKGRRGCEEALILVRGDLTSHVPASDVRGYTITLVVVYPPAPEGVRYLYDPKPAVSELPPRPATVPSQLPLPREPLCTLQVAARAL